MTIVLPRVRIGVSTKENIPRTFHHKILRTGQLLVASLTVALAIACGSKLPVAMFAPQTSKAAVDSQLSVAAVDSQPSRPMVAPPPSRKAVGALTAGAIGEDAAVTTPETCKGTGNILPSGNATTPTDLQINGVNCIVDGSGNVRETDMKGKRKKGRGARNDLCKPAKRRKR